MFALAGTLQLSHMHISTHLNVLLHSTPKHHLRPHDSGVLDSAIAYSTSPLGRKGGSGTDKVIIGDPLPLRLSVRWFPTPKLPKTEGKVEWHGMGGHVFASTVWYSVVSFWRGYVCGWGLLLWRGDAQTAEGEGAWGCDAVGLWHVWRRERLGLSGRRERIDFGRRERFYCL